MTGSRDQILCETYALPLHVIKPRSATTAKVTVGIEFRTSSDRPWDSSLRLKISKMLPGIEDSSLLLKTPLKPWSPMYELFNCWTTRTHSRASFWQKDMRSNVDGSDG